MRPGVGELLVQDSFTDPSVWSLSTSNDASATISKGSLNLSLKSAKTYLISTRSEPVFTDFYAEISATANFCHGEDEYGLVVRSVKGNQYRLALACNGQVKVDRLYNGSLSRQAGWLQNAIIPSIMPSTVRLQVWAVGSQMRFFVNDFYLFSVTDRLLYKGTVGVFVHTSGESDVSVSFSNLKVSKVTK